MNRAGLLALLDWDTQGEGNGPVSRPGDRMDMVLYGTDDCDMLTSAMHAGSGKHRSPPPRTTVAHEAHARPALQWLSSPSSISPSVNTHHRPLLNVIEFHSLSVLSIQIFPPATAP